MARQFVDGKRFFLRRVRRRVPRRSWLPDSFGYSAALPQIVAAGREPLVPHPEDLLEPDQQDAAPHLLVGGHRRHPGLHPLPAGRHLQLRAARRPSWRTPSATTRTTGRGTVSLVPFGYGDGGGGPTREMIAARAPHRGPRGLARRCGSSTPRELLRARPRPSTPTLPVWAGEMYLELHRGTYTSQASDQAGQPPQRAPAARGRAVVRHRGGPDRRAATRTSELQAALADWCCCSSSTTSCPAARSPGSTATPSGTTPRVGRRARKDHRRALPRCSGAGEPGRSCSTPPRTRATACRRSAAAEPVPAGGRPSRSTDGRRRLRPGQRHHPRRDRRATGCSSR